MEGYDRTIVGWREGETHGNSSCVTLFVLRIAATSPCRGFEIIPAISSPRVCCGDDVATFRVTTRALSLIDQGLPADIIYFDFQKAFDKMPHERLLLKVETYGIVGRVSGWIRDWLKGRQQCVMLNGS